MVPSLTSRPDSGPAAEPERLRRALVDAISTWRGQLGTTLSSEVGEAIRAVSRHLFVPPETPMGEAYDSHHSVVTRRDEHGIAMSAVSAPSIIAMMLDQLRVKPGQKVLEVGSGLYRFQSVVAV